MHIYGSKNHRNEELHMRILLAEDESDLNMIIKSKLIDEGYSVDACQDGREALSYLRSTAYDAAILDIMMPEMDGIDVLRTARSEGIRVPVLFLTARDSVQDRVSGLDAGAEDYMIKPFSFEELMARIRVLTRGSRGQSKTLLTIGDLTVDTSSRCVERAGRRIDLSAREYQLLVYMMLNAGIVLSREKIEDTVWPSRYESDSNLIDVYVSHLRKKVDGDFDFKMIRTVRGFGYMLVKT